MKTSTFCVGVFFVKKNKKIITTSFQEALYQVQNKQFGSSSSQKPSIKHRKCSCNLILINPILERIQTCKWGFGFQITHFYLYLQKLKLFLVVKSTIIFWFLFMPVVLLGQGNFTGNIESTFQYLNSDSVIGANQPPSKGLLNSYMNVF